MTPGERKSLIKGVAFISPWILGFLAFNLYPLIASIWFSFCDYSVLSQPVFLGTQNYVDLWRDPVFWKALQNTVVFAAVAIPLSTFLSIGLAVLLNQPSPFPRLRSMRTI